MNQYTVTLAGLSVTQMRPETKPSTSTKKAKRGSKKAALKKKRRNPVIRHGGRTEDEASRVVLDDEGTELEVIGSDRLHVLEKPSKSANMGGQRAGMDRPTLPIVNTLCAYDSPMTGKDCWGWAQMLGAIGVNIPSVDQHARDAKEKNA